MTHSIVVDRALQRRLVRDGWHGSRSNVIYLVYVVVALAWGWAFMSGDLGRTAVVTGTAVVVAFEAWTYRHVVGKVRDGYPLGSTFGIGFGVDELRHVGPFGESCIAYADIVDLRVDGEMVVATLYTGWECSFLTGLFPEGSEDSPALVLGRILISADRGARDIGDTSPYRYSVVVDDRTQRALISSIVRQNHLRRLGWIYLVVAACWGVLRWRADLDLLSLACGLAAIAAVEYIRYSWTAREVRTAAPVGGVLRSGFDAASMTLQLSDGVQRFPYASFDNMDERGAVIALRLRSRYWLHLPAELVPKDGPDNPDVVWDRILAAEAGSQAAG